MELLLLSEPIKIYDEEYNLHSNMELLLLIFDGFLTDAEINLHSNMELLLLKKLGLEMSDKQVFTFQYGATSTIYFIF